jgi:D-glycero-D-manno-heptose 1,7-bisphosphate phosphatase
MTTAVFLDRDGVLNEVLLRGGKPGSPRSLDEFMIVAEAPAALRALKQSGYRLIVATNQPDNARGKMTRGALAAMHRRLSDLLPIDSIEVCAHDDDDNCGCRKPLPGLLRRAAERDHVVLADSFMVGDRWRDIEAGRRAGCRTVLIGDGYGERMKSPPDAIMSNLSEAVAWILAQTSGGPTV